MKSINSIINNFLLAGDRFMPEMHYDKLDLQIVLVDHLLKTKKEFKNIKNQGIQYIFIKKNYIKPAFSIAWLMVVLKINLEE